MAALIFLFLNLVASFLKSKRWANRAAEDRSLSNMLYLASIWVIPIIVAATFHEAAHGFVAHLSAMKRHGDLGASASIP